MSSKDKWTRREFLKTAGVAGAFTFAGAAAGSYSMRRTFSHGTEDQAGQEDAIAKEVMHEAVFVTNMHELRTNDDLDPHSIYYLNDAGQSGFFQYDPEDTASPDNTGTILVSESGKRWKRMDYSGRYNIKWFGAKGDGETDDTEAIQAAINAAFRDGGGTVYFPKGTFIVSPRLDQCILLWSNVHLLGEGTNSTVKVKKDAGDYYTIFGQVGGSVYVENVRISHLRIDQDPKNNTTCNIDRTNPARYYWQYSIHLGNYHNIVIDHVIFDEICGINTVKLSNPKSSYATITNCYFNFVMGKGDPEYDNSAIYLNGTNHIVANNVFYCELGQKGRGAIETHTGQSVIANNVTDGYYTAVNAQSSELNEVKSDITISNNTIVNANQGIQLWGYHNNPIAHVTVTGNTISLANTYHKRYLCTGISSGGSYETTAFNNLMITDNTILFEEELEVRVGIVESTVGGIRFTSTTPNTNFIISNNIIKNSPLTGILIGSGSMEAKVSNILISGNLLENCGHYPAKETKYKSGIMVRSQVTGVKISNNIISDRYDEVRAAYAIRMSEEDGVYKDVQVNDNLVSTNAGELSLELASNIQSRA